MSRLIIVCEGPTEQEFCKNVLAPELFRQGIFVDTPLIKQSGGGILSWHALKRQIEGHLHEADAYVTMLIDYYGIKDSHKFPMWEDSKEISDKAKRIHFLCTAMLRDISKDLQQRFIPYIQLHEFEGLLYSDISKFKNWFDDKSMDFKILEAARKSFDNPELINNGPKTAPSKRLIAAIPSYDKVLIGNCIAMDIGIDTIRKECPIFNEWMSRLEQL